MQIIKLNVSRIKKPRFAKEQEAKGLLSNLGIKTPLSKIPLLKCKNECDCEQFYIGQ